jgi:ElaB/YqjD/DUF883 family membrane-anchored ribosome-binding protein
MTSPHDRVANADSGELLRSLPAIRSDIEQTRERLGESVEALGAQLNPSHLAQRVKDRVREATIGKVQTMASNAKSRMTESGREVTQTIRDNPVPAAIAAASIGWLLLNRRDGKSRSDDFFMDSDDGRYHDGDERSGVREMTSAVGDKIHGVGEQAQEVTERVSEKAKDLTSRMTDKAKAAGDRLSQSADGAVSQVRHTARRASRRVEGEYQENPLMLGAVALALGLAVGVSLPRTRKEVEMVGDASDRLMDKARGQIASTTERVEGVIERALPEVKSVVREAAREVGLSSPS